MNPDPTSLDRLLRVRGTVQGVGFRPFVARLAAEHGIRGWVRNDAQGVLIRAAGTATQLAHFAANVSTHAPNAARVDALEWLEPEAGLPAADGHFAIVESIPAAAAVGTNVPPDLAPCPECEAELLNDADRRHGYVFINCTQCGPRYSIIERLPYDRPQTTMRCFRMCPACEREYRDPIDRRYHAEPNACPACGPGLRFMDASGTEFAAPAQALRCAAEAIRSGCIVAVKGVGGFHLMADAADETAVAELRRRKHREEKPLAVMFAHLAQLEGWATLTPDASAALTLPERPVVLVPARHLARAAPSVAPGNPWIGAMLPSSPLHILLLAAVGRPVVATSANLSDEPLCTDDDEARRRLGGVADFFLGHNRPIARPVDDSVLRFTAAGAPILLRRARGYAPTPFALPAALSEPHLCVGAQMKATIAVAAGRRVVLSPHLGDLEHAATHAVFTRTIETLGELFATRCAVIAHDKHPDYASTRHALSSGRRTIAVQHHLAHVLAVLLEHGVEADNVLGVSWDGTGYGEDGTIWGGEFIWLRQGRARRFARLRPFRLPGGDAAVRDPRRVGYALTAQLDPARADEIAARFALGNADRAVLDTMIARGLNAPWCSSVGRLFDAFGALTGLRQRNAFEGQTPLAVEIAATGAAASARALPFAVEPAPAAADWEIDWRPAIETACHGTSDAAELAAGFHRGLARAIADVARRSGAPVVALGGGCFQNALLRELAERELTRLGVRVLAARELPPNDGGIAAGQALAALWQLTTVELPSSSAAVGANLPPGR